jgi:hypothetical protein
MSLETSSTHSIPIHLQPFYREKFGNQRGDFPIASAEFQRLVSLPLYPRMSDHDVTDVIAAVQSNRRSVFHIPAGRQRFNVLGALNAITHPALRISVTNDTYITAESVCTLLHKLAALNLTVPISIFLDNARYQKCALLPAGLLA